jgi:hypothetical protein
MLSVKKKKTIDLVLIKLENVKCLPFGILMVFTFYLSFLEAQRTLPFYEGLTSPFSFSGLACPLGPCLGRLGSGLVGATSMWAIRELIGLGLSSKSPQVP